MHPNSSFLRTNLRSMVKKKVQFCAFRLYLWNCSSYSVFQPTVGFLIKNYIECTWSLCSFAKILGCSSLFFTFHCEEVLALQFFELQISSQAEKKSLLISKIKKLVMPKKTQFISPSPFHFSLASDHWTSDHGHLCPKSLYLY